MARSLALAAVVMVLWSFLGCVPLQQRPTVLVPSEIFHADPPPEARTLWAEAEGLRRQGKLREAALAFDRIAQFFPNNAIAPRALTEEGRLWLALNDPKTAEKVFHQALTRFPQWRDQIQARIGLLQARWIRAHKTRTLEEALALWDQTSSDPKARLELCLLLARMTADVNEPENALSWLAQGYRLSVPEKDKRRLDEAAFRIVDSLNEASVNRVISNVTDPRLLPFLAYRRAQFQSPAKRRDTLLALLAQYPEHPVARKIEESLEGAVVEAKPADPNRLGCLLPLTGKHGTFGRRILKGIALALEQWHQKHPANPVKLVIQDTEASPEKAETAFSSLVTEQGVLAVLGPLSPRCAETLMPLMNRWGVPVISFTEKRTVDADTPFLFHAFVDHRDMIRSLVTYCRNHRGFTRFAVLYPDERYGRALSRIFAEEVKNSGGTVLAQVPYAPRSTDFKGPISTLLKEAQRAAGVSVDESPIEALFIPDTAKTVALIAPQLPYYNVVGATLIGTNLWEETALISVGGVYVENALFPSAFYREEEPSFYGPRDVADFAATYRKVYGEEPDYLAAQAYTAMLLALTARREAFFQGSPSDRVRFRQILLETSLEEGPLGPVRFAPDGHLVRDYPILQVTNGTLVRVTP